MPTKGIDSNTLLLIAEDERRKRIGKSFRSFVDKVAPGYIWYRHCEVLGGILDRVVAGEIKRLMVFMPPRHGKSEAVSRLFSAYWLYKFPKSQVGLTSYAADLAHGLSRSSRDFYERSGKAISADVSAAREWETVDGGIMWAAGVGGPITGKGFELGIIDDPIKNAEEAESETVRRSQIEWYQSTWATRREPRAAEIVIQTRWHVNDLSGWLLQQERENPQGWHILNLEAIKTDNENTFPETCVVEPDWRHPGDALCPERYDKDALGTRKHEVGSRHWSALYQQRPTIDTGNIWKREWFRGFKLGDEPELIDVGADWDLAYTDNDSNSASAFIKSGRDAHGNIYVVDLGCKYLEFPELIPWMASQQVPHFIEAKASGKSARQVLRANNVYAEEVSVTGGDKVARTRLATPMAEQGKVFVAEHLLDTLLDDPKQGILKAGNGFESDLNDAFVQALNRHNRRRVTTRIY